MSEIRILLQVVAAFTATRIAIPLVAYLANWRVEKFQYFTRHGHWLDPLFQWDGPIYWHIATGGYVYDPGAASNVAFFPLYPLLIRIAGLLLQDYILAGFVVSNLCLIGAGYYLWKLCEAEGWGEDGARRTVLLMYAFPTSFYASLYYTEALFLLTCFAAMYLAVQRKWAGACAVAALAGATRITGILLLLPLLLEYFRVRADRWREATWRVDRHFAWFLLVPLGLLGFMALLNHQFGDPFVFMKTQSFWGRTEMTYAATLATICTFMPFEVVLYSAALLVWAAATVYLVFARLRIGYAAFILVALLFAMRSGSLESIHRYLASMFPLYLAVGHLAGRNRWVETALLGPGLALMAFLVVLYASGYRIY